MPRMPRFFFTYGTEGQPFFGGWTEAEAPDIKAACTAFRVYHPDKTKGLLNCSGIYTEAEFVKADIPGSQRKLRLLVPRDYYIAA